MTYVEWLRVRGALKWTAIVFAILFVGVAALRIYMFSRGDVNSFIGGIQNDPGSTVTRSVLDDGTNRTVIVDKSGKTTITIDDHGYSGKHIEIVDRSGHAGDTREKSVEMGSVHVEALPAGDGERVVIDTNEKEPFVFIAAFAAFVGLIVATVLGAPFARENEGHLEIALTKPVSRVVLALATVGVDLAGIAGAWLLTVVFLVACIALFQMPHISFDGNDFAGTVLGLLGGFAWYAMLCAATSSMKRAYGVVLGLAWPFAILIFILAKADLGTYPIFVALHQAAKVVAYVMPFSYLHFGPAMTIDGRPAGSAAFSAATEAPALAALAIAYVALAAAQWRRVEA